MDIKLAITELIKRNYEPTNSVDAAEHMVTAVRLHARLKEVYPELDSPGLVADVLNELGFVVVDLGDLEFVYLLRGRPVL